MPLPRPPTCRIGSYSNRRFRRHGTARWGLANRVLPELEDVGSLAQALVATVARRHRLSHAALNALAVLEGNGGPCPPASSAAGCTSPAGP